VTQRDLVRLASGDGIRRLIRVAAAALVVLVLMEVPPLVRRLASYPKEPVRKSLVHAKEGDWVVVEGFRLDCSSRRFRTKALWDVVPAAQDGHPFILANFPFACGEPPSSFQATVRIMSEGDAAALRGQGFPVGLGPRELYVCYSCSPSEDWHSVLLCCVLASIGLFMAVHYTRRSVWTRDVERTLSRMR
jgi:hypothetical protein